MVATKVTATDGIDFGVGEGNRVDGDGQSQVWLRSQACGLSQRQYCNLNLLPLLLILNACITVLR
eukprot:8598992-Pyramimonas_sp.AAC.2